MSNSIEYKMFSFKLVEEELCLPLNSMHLDKLEGEEKSIVLQVEHWGQQSNRWAIGLHFDRN